MTDAGRQKASLPLPKTTPRYRLAILAMHVIQYHSPLYRKLAQSDKIDPTVLFLDKTGAHPAYDKTMKAMIQWDIPLLDGYKYYFLPNWSPFKTRFGINRINPSLLFWLKKKRFDGVFLQGYTAISYWLGLVAAKLSGIDVIFRGEATLKKDNSSSPAECIKSLCLGSILKHSDAVLYSCTGNRKYFEHYGCDDEKLHPFTSAVDNDYFRAQIGKLCHNEDNLRQQLGISQDTFVVLTVGRIDKRKRQGDLISAVNALQKRGYNISLVIVGDGPEKTRLEMMVLEKSIRNIHFVGFKNQSKIAAYYYMSDVFVLCSTYDPSPKVINEALNFSLPLVCSDCLGTVGDIVIDTDNAFVFNAGNVGQLTDVVERLIRNPDLRKRMGSRSYQLSDKWTLEENVKSLENVIEHLRHRR